MNVRAYKKELPYTYVEGFYPILEAIQYRKTNIRKIVFHSKAKQSKTAATIQQSLPSHQIEFNDGFIHRFASHDYCLALAVIDKYEAPVIIENNMVVLYQPSDMGNMGTIIRSMTAFGIHDLICIKSAADVMNPKVIRASMGSLFQIRFSYLTVDEFVVFQKKTAQMKWFHFDKDAKTIVSKVAFEKPFTLIFGNEGAGLPPVITQLSTAVAIPQVSSIDSLNLAVSVGIVLYETFSKTITA